MILADEPLDNADYPKDLLAGAVTIMFASLCGESPWVPWQSPEPHSSLFADDGAGLPARGPSAKSTKLPSV